MYVIFTCRPLISYAYWKTRISGKRNARSRLICNVNERRQHADKTRQHKMYSLKLNSQNITVRIRVYLTRQQICDNKY